MPWDPWCESRVIIAFLHKPDQIRSYPEITDLLWGNDHQMLWRAMRDLPEGLSPGEFAYALRDHVARRWPDRFDRLWSVLTSQYETEIRHERNIYYALQHGRRLKNPYALTWSDWIERLEECALARRLIQAAQDMAERAWAVDTDGARGIMDRWYTARSTFNS